MRNQKIQAFVLVAIVFAALVLIAYRTTTHWQNVERQTIKDSLGSQLLLVSHEIQESSQRWVSYIKNLKSESATAEVIFRGTVVKSESGKWQLRDSFGNKQAGFNFIKQVDWEKAGGQPQWLSIRSDKEETHVGLLIPDSTGVYISAIIDRPFAAVIDLFKGAFASVFVADKKMSLLAHSREGYVGTKFDISRPQRRLNSFSETKDNQGRTLYLSTYALPELNLILGATIAKSYSASHFNSWVLEVFGVAVLLAVGLYFFFKKKALMSPPAKVSIMPAISGETRGNFELLKSFSGMLSEQLTAPMEQMLSYFRLLKSKNGKEGNDEIQQIERESEKLREVVDTLHTVGKTLVAKKEPVNLGALIRLLVPDLKVEAQKQNIEFIESLSNVGDILANGAQMRSLVQAMVKIAFFNVRLDKQKKVSLILRGDAKQLHLSVYDSGPERKVQIDHILTEPSYYDQLGLSLPLAYSIVKAYAGSIELLYDKNLGNQIIVKLPTEDLKTPTKHGPDKAKEIKERFREIQAQLPEIKIRAPKVRTIQT